MPVPYREWVKSLELEQVLKYVGFQPHQSTHGYCGNIPTTVTECSQARRQGRFKGVCLNPPFGLQKILYTV